MKKFDGDSLKTGASKFTVFSFFRDCKKSFIQAWLNFLRRRPIFCLFLSFSVVSSAMWAHVDFIASILEPEVPLDQLKKLEGTLLDIEKSRGRRGRLSYYLLLQVQNENHRFPLCFLSHEEWDWAKKARGQSVTIWLRPRFQLIYWEDCVDQIKHGNSFLRDYSAVYSRRLTDEQNFPQRIKWHLYRIFGPLGFVWLFYRTPARIKVRRK